jgi:hypothetical protein
VDGLSEIAERWCRQRKRRVVAPQNDPSGKHAGHVLRVEKGNRAVKALQRHSAGCTQRLQSAENGGTYLEETRACRRAGQRMAVMRDERLKGASIWCFFPLVARGIDTRPNRGLAGESDFAPVLPDNGCDVQAGRRTHGQSALWKASRALKLRISLPDDLSLCSRRAKDCQQQLCRGR